jgi:branched-chain amino acid transport system permease protein
MRLADLWPAAILAAAAVLAPWLDNYQLYVLALVAIYALFAVGYTLLMGCAGQFDFGQAAFLGIGAFGMALLQTRAGLPFWLALPLAGAVALLFGLAIGAVVLRLEGFYLALVTLSFNLTVVLVLSLAKDFTGGFQGTSVPRPSLEGVRDQALLFLIVVGVASGLVWTAGNLVRSRTGTALFAMRDSEVAAEAMGVNLVRYRLMAYGLSAFYGGVAGGLLATLLGHVTPEGFGISETIKVLTMIVVGGLGNIVGAVLGAAALTLSAELLRFSQVYQEIGNGLLLFLFVLLMPQGIIGALRHGRARWARSWAF